MTAPLWLLVLVGVLGPIVGAVAMALFFRWCFPDVD